MYAKRDVKDARKCRRATAFLAIAPCPIDLKVMFTSLFGKRDRQPEDEDCGAGCAGGPEAQADQEPERRGFFDRMRQAVTRTRESFSESMGSGADPRDR